MGKSKPISSLCAPAWGAVDLWRPAFQCGGRLQQEQKLIGEAMGPCSVQGFGTAGSRLHKGSSTGVSAGQRILSQSAAFLRYILSVPELSPSAMVWRPWSVSIMAGHRQVLPACWALLDRPALQLCTLRKARGPGWAGDYRARRTAEARHGVTMAAFFCSARRVYSRGCRRPMSASQPDCTP